MIAHRGDAAPAPKDTRFQHGIALGKIGGGSETHSLGTSQVADQELRVAVRGTLEAALLLTADGEPAPFVLDATLVNLEQPLAGFDITVVCRMKYSLRDTQAGREVLNTTIEAPFSAGLGDAFFGTKRVQIANEGAVRANLERLLDAIARLGPPTP